MPVRVARTDEARNVVINSIPSWNIADGNSSSIYFEPETKVGRYHRYFVFKDLELDGMVGEERWKDKSLVENQFQMPVGWSARWSAGRKARRWLVRWNRRFTMRWVLRWWWMIWRPVWWLRSW